MLAWTLTDGNADDEARCLGVAEAVADRVERRRVSPRAPWSWLAPFGPIDPRDDPGLGGPIAPVRGWPEVAVASGRKAAPYLAAVKRASNGRTITAFLGASVAGRAIADVVAVTHADRLRGPNVVVSAARPHRVGQVSLAAARGSPPLFAAGAGPKVAVLLGSAGLRRWSGEDADRFEAGLVQLVAERARIAAVLGENAGGRLALAVSRVADYLWDRQGRDPTIRLLAQADAIVVSAADLLSVDAAVATGAPVLAFRPRSLDRGASRAVDRLAALGVVRPFPGRIEAFAYPPVDATAEIACAVSALVATRAALGPREERRTPARSTENGPSLR